MVGARYIRDHEIKYIDEIKAVLAEAGLQDRVTILDCQDEVFPVRKLPLSHILCRQHACVS